MANRLPVGGFRAVADLLHRTRHNIAWHALGEAIACYEIALAYALAGSNSVARSPASNSSRPNSSACSARSRRPNFW